MHQIWCVRCGQPIPWRATAPTCEYDADATERIQLYDAILKDLARLRDAGKASPPEFKPIHRFYQRQIQLLDQPRIEQERLQAQFRLIHCAREAAQSEHFEEACILFKQAAQSNDCNYPLDKMLRETDERSQKKEHESQRTDQLVALLQLARQQIASRDTTGAKESLNRARNTISDLSNATDFQKQMDALEMQLSGARAWAETAAQSQINSESVIIANLVDPSTLSVGSSPWQLDCTPNASPQLETLNGCSDPSSSADANGEVLSTGSEVPVAVNAPRGMDESVPETHVTTQTPTAPDDDKPTARTEQAKTFAPPEEVPSTAQRLIDHTSQWSSMIKPFLLDNVGWFVGAFLVVAGFVVLIVTFWSSIEQNRILMHSIVYCCLTIATGMFFYVAYFMRRRYPELESSSNVLLVIVALLVPLVFAAALLTSFVPPGDTAALIPMS